MFHYYGRGVMDASRFKGVVDGLYTGLCDADGQPIYDGGYISLDGQITNDDSMGLLPNGWVFTEEDVYQVRYDAIINNWVLDLPVNPDSDYNRKYLSHACCLLHNSNCLLVEGL